MLGVSWQKRVDIKSLRSACHAAVHQSQEADNRATGIGTLLTCGRQRITRGWRSVTQKPQSWCGSGTYGGRRWTLARNLLNTLHFCHPLVLKFTVERGYVYWVTVRKPKGVDVSVRRGGKRCQFQIHATCSQGSACTRFWVCRGLRQQTDSSLLDPLLLTAFNDNQDDELFPLTLAASRSHL